MNKKKLIIGIVAVVIVIASIVFAIISMEDNNTSNSDFNLSTTKEVHNF